MDMCIEKDCPESLVINHPSACYVCGSPNSATHFLRTKPPITSQPYFPFLKHHKQPVDCKPSNNDGFVSVCYVCYSFLISQWESHEKNKTPYYSRLYWLKRVDQGPYSGTDINQDDKDVNASLPLTKSMTHLEKIKEIPPSPGNVPSTGQTENCINVLKRPRSTSWDNQQLDVGLSHSKIEKCPPGQSEMADKSISEALDLRSLASVKRERQSVISYSNSCNILNPQAGEGGVEILDLSMPDKNATTEVCYVCGDEFQKGLLSHVFAKSIQRYPFFPSLMLHPRPSRSRPMDSAGRVQACEVCHAYLLQQWQQHQTRSTPHAERNYLLRNRQSTAYDTTTFICYACGLEYPSSSLRLLYCRPNAESEPYFPFLENAVAPNGSSPISPQGLVQVCAICYKSIPQRFKVFGPVETVVVVAPRLVSPPPLHSLVGLASDNVETQTPLAAQLCCYVCHKMSERDAMKVLSCYPDCRSTGTDTGIGQADPLMHFPFVKTLPTPPGPAYFDSFNRTLLCADCFAHLNHQWNVFESDGLALQLRHYTLPSSVQTNETSKTAGASVKIPAEALPIAMCSSKTMSLIGDGRTPTSHSANRTPPNSRTGSSTSPGVAPSCLETHKDKDKSLVVESSIYCYLCGLNSTREFSHWLPAAAPPPAVPTSGSGSGSGSSSGSGSGSGSSTMTPYFPYLRRFAASSRAEKLREDGAALVCSFCYHMVRSQWKQYEDAPAAKSLQPDTRVYNTHDYVCYVCSVATYRRRVRALPVKDFPFLKQHRQPRHSLSIESGKFVVVCLDCFESLRSQSLEYERWGLPVEKRQYNWMAIPPPPEDSNNLSTPLERLLAMEQQKRHTRSKMIAAAAAVAETSSSIQQQSSDSSEDVAKRIAVDPTTTHCHSVVESNRDIIQ